MREGIEQDSETFGGGHSYYLILVYQYRNRYLNDYENREKFLGKQIIHKIQDIFKSQCIQV